MLETPPTVGCIKLLKIRGGVEIGIHEKYGAGEQKWYEMNIERNVIEFIRIPNYSL